MFCYLIEPSFLPLNPASLNLPTQLSVLLTYGPMGHISLMDLHLSRKSLLTPVNLLEWALT